MAAGRAEACEDQLRRGPGGSPNIHGTSRESHDRRGSSGIPARGSRFAKGSMNNRKTVRPSAPATSIENRRSARGNRGEELRKRHRLRYQELQREQKGTAARHGGKPVARRNLRANRGCRGLVLAKPIERRLGAERLAASFRRDRPGFLISRPASAGPSILKFPFWLAALWIVSEPSMTQAGSISFSLEQVRHASSRRQHRPLPSDGALDQKRARCAYSDPSAPPPPFVGLRGRPVHAMMPWAAAAATWGIPRTSSRSQPPRVLSLQKGDDTIVPLQQGGPRLLVPASSPWTTSFGCALGRGSRH